MAYELWETASGNLLDTFATEEAALEEVRATIGACGREAVATYALARETRRRTTLIAQGDALAALAERALASAPATEPAEPAEPTAPPRAAVTV